jgi:chemotaxis response regulator CheB
MKRLCILSPPCLLGRGVETLLSQQDGLEIVCTKTELADVLPCIQTCRPDVVIINCRDLENDMCAVVGELSRGDFDVSIIGISLTENKICIHRGEHKQVQEVDDLIKAIQH